MVTLFHIGKGRWSLDLLLRFKPLHSAPPYQMFIVSKVMKYKGSIKMSTLIEGDIASIQPRVSYHYAGVRILIDEAMGSSVSLTSFPDAVTNSLIKDTLKRKSLFQFTLPSTVHHGEISTEQELQQRSHHTQRTDFGTFSWSLFSSIVLSNFVVLVFVFNLTLFCYIF